MVSLQTQLKAIQSSTKASELTHIFHLDRHRQSPAPNNHDIPISTILRKLNTPQRRPPSILQRNTYPPHRHRSLCLRPIRRLPLRATSLRREESQIHRQRHALLRPILHSRCLRRYNKHSPLLAHRARTYQTSDTTSRCGPSIQWSARLYAQAVSARGRAERLVPWHSRDVPPRSPSVRHLVPNL